MKVLTKLLWRKDGICVFIHVDDGLGIVWGRERALRANRRVRKDLDCYGILASEKKSKWGARRKIVWTDFLWDTMKFKLFVPEEKLVRVEGMLEELWKVRKENMEVRRIA